MLINLTLRNFKIWETTGLIRLAPVTLLLGTNSSGKSSIIQSLLLIRQTVRNKEPNVSLHFGIESTSDSVALGQFSDVLCRHSPGKEIEIEFAWSPTGRNEDAYTFSAGYLKNSTGATDIAKLRLGKAGTGFSVTRQSKGAFKLHMANGKRVQKKSRDFHPQNSFTFSAATLARLPSEDSEDIRAAGSALLEELERIIYLGPVRQLARRHYSWDGIPPSTLGDDGDRAIDALIASGLLAKKGKVGGELFQQTARWLTEMGLATGIDVKRIGTTSLYELRILGENNSSSSLKDVGVGVSQVLPVIVACLHAPAGHTVIVEEPESHLHPLAQSILAELFSQVSQERNIQVIAETHSEHLFRRIQTLVAKDSLKQPSCALYFIERKGEKSELRPLEVDPYGRIKNWPDKFFGDTLGETKAQTDLMMQKLREQKKNAQAD
jgi:energy-coupling factor transporter ATP-binding protein EcfA2